MVGTGPSSNGLPDTLHAANRLLTNFECSTMWVKHRKALLDALSLTPEYLKSKEYEEGLVYDYR